MTDIRAIREITPESGLQCQTLELAEKNKGELLLHWMRELLYYFSAKRLVFFRFEFERLTEKTLKVKAAGTVFDPARHVAKSEVKAVTYHGFVLSETSSGWQAEIILDL